MLEIYINNFIGNTSFVVISGISYCMVDIHNI